MPHSQMSDVTTGGKHMPSSACSIASTVSPHVAVMVDVVLQPGNTKDAWVQEAEAPHTDSHVVAVSGFVTITPQEPSPMQTVPVGHFAPHAPQLSGSDMTLMHAPLQRA